MPRSQAQKRWEQRHQRVTVFISKDLKKSLEKFKGKASYPDLIKKAIKDIAQISKDAEDRYKIEIPCYHCAGSLVVVPGGPIHKHLLDAQHNERWKHEECH